MEELLRRKWVLIPKAQEEEDIMMRLIWPEISESFSFKMLYILITI